jgi:hypothetical protein
MGMERRQFYRVSPHMTVRLEPAGMPPISGHVANVSMQGLLVSCSGSAPVGTACAVTISLGAPDAAIRGHAMVVRVDPGTLAMHITELDGPESYEHLRNLVMYNAEDPDRVKQEIDRWLRRGGGDDAR